MLYKHQRKTLPLTSLAITGLMMAACQNVTADTERIALPQKVTAEEVWVTAWPQKATEVTRLQSRPLRLNQAVHYQIQMGSPVVWVLDLPTKTMTWLVITEEKTVFEVSYDASSKQWKHQLSSLSPYPGSLKEAPALHFSSETKDWKAPSGLASNHVISRPPIDGCNTKALLTQATNDYPHGVFGETIEPTAVSLTPGTASIQAPPGYVFETYQPLMLENCSLLLTLSHPETGAGLALYDLTGKLLAKSEAIGTPFRWIHMLGAARWLPNSPEEIVVVRTPHIGGVIELYQHQGETLVKKAQLEGFTSHPNGTQNLYGAKLGIFGDNDNPGLLIATQDRTALHFIQRNASGLSSVHHWELSAPMRSNLRQAAEFNSLSFGTADGILHIYTPYSQTL